MTEPAGPLFAGVHLAWAEVPARVQAWASGLREGGITGVVDLQGGFSPGATSRLTFASGDLFVKAVGLDLNADSPTLHRREIAISAALPEGPMFPHLIDAYDDGDWVALAFEAVDGRMPSQPWQPEDLSLAIAAVVGMHHALTPPPLPAMVPAEERFAPLFGGWAGLASGPIPDGLDQWSQRHLDRLADLESGWPPACAGGTLVHGDLRSDNMLLAEHGAVIVDWPHAAVGSPMLDVVCWAPSVALEGGPLPEALFERHATWAAVDQDALAALVAAVAGFFISHSLKDPPPGLPTLRAFQAAQGEVTRAWLARLTGWS